MKTIYSLLMWLSIVSGLIGGAYVGGYLMFVKPIIECLAMYDAGLLTGSIIGMTIIKCIFAGTVGGAIFCIGYFLGLVFLYMKEIRK